ncbi:MAG TPA: S-adenosylmethionine:tRNA ribosyltransferase-isomerase [Cyclobacteriaceae bacterium]|nr:S-adenosylmethionine:tRNA ribosyltransferase-isomerase [Cyclobacteriaceae bacterium]
MSIPSIHLSDYQYYLPDEKIAKFPLEKRDASKLLCFEQGEISHHQFVDLPDLLPSDTLMVFNNTKVIPARLVFQRSSGAKVEIFLLKPLAPSQVINQVMEATHSVTWETMIGNLKKWKEDEVLLASLTINDKHFVLEAHLEDREQKVVRFHWKEEIPFVAIVEAGGEIPLPPYLNRKAVDEDKPRYQTVYSQKEGAVAAPTAGLHFTTDIFKELSKKGVDTDYLTLHVGAGTFQPIKDEEVVRHAMHSEQVVIHQNNLKKLLAHKGNIVAVGTTSMRSLESLYWFGVKLLSGEGTEFFIPKLYPYQEHKTPPSLQDSLQAILNWMKENKRMEITGHTEIMIMPGYHFKVCNGLVTNFHQPGSTLILLVAAFTNNHWRKIYEEALNQSYRFLSYGDSNLLWNNKI